MTQTSPTDKTQGVIDVEALKKEIREQILSELKEQKQEQKPEDQRENLVKNNLLALAAGQKNPRLLRKKLEKKLKS
ncbi:hypothetical protein TVAGG3_0894620 [Trichomonas vaginalis G3]|uniref:hypothetical protein n=1 Tax=Trichomonas vaginalis (strain ATCC PRA-98 / G3) TaxID=412133 RepID=UPI0021E5B03F|nr:hypothetical protein TVAGG3_0894620 [Trichomonas vaginalis G3]KAI5502975.1 hypothetical protein TVAGG3_0894620 [Trichomonas vaginalis G3]